METIIAPIIIALGIVFAYLCIMMPVNISRIARDIKAIRKSSEAAAWYAEFDHTEKYGNR